MRTLGLHNILIATDLSADTASTIDSAAQLAELTGANVCVMHATEDIKHMAELQKRIEQNVAGNRKRPEVQVITGPPVAIISQEASRIEADVIVLGRHRGPARGLGSTADRVVRTARVPCLILPDRLALPLSSVVVPVDIGQAARGTLAVALTWASALRRRGSPGPEEPTRVDIFHVRTDNESAELADLQRRLHEEIEGIRNGLADVAGVSIDQAVETSVDIPGTVLKHAQDRRADLIVLGTRAKRIETDPLGSVSSEIVKRATQPVLLVPPEVWRPDAEEILAWRRAS